MKTEKSQQQYSNYQLRVILQLSILLFLWIDPANQTMTCSSSATPFIYGGSNQNTWFNAMSTDSSGNILTGGSTSDNVIVSGGQKGIAVFYNSDGTVKWANYYSHSSANGAMTAINAVYLEQSDNEVYLGMGGVDLLLAIVDYSTGRSVSAQKNIFSASNSGKVGYISSGGIRTDGDSHIAVAVQYNNQWALISFWKGTCSLRTSLVQPGTSYGRAYVLIDTETRGDVYVGGFLQKASVSNKYMAITRVTTTAIGDDFTAAWTWSNDQASSSANFYVRRLYLEQSTKRKLYACSEQTVVGQLQFAQLSLNSAYSVSSVVAFQSAQSAFSMTCAGVYGSTGTTMYAFFSDLTANNDNYFARVSIVILNFQIELSTGSFYYTKLAIFSNGDANTFLNEAIFSSATSAYYAGASKKIYGTPNYSFNKQLGMVMSLSASQSCISYTETEVTGTAMTSITSWTQLSAVNYGTFSATMDCSVFTTKTTCGTATPNHAVTCNSAITLTPSIIPDSSYIVASTAMTIIFDAFTLPSSCTGQSLAYTAVLSGGSTLPSFITFTSSSRSFSISTSLNANVGTYTIMVTGAVDGGTTYTATSTFVLTVTSSCPYATITASAPTTQTYVVSQTAAVYNIPVFTSNVTAVECPITYTLTLQTGAAIDTTLITFTASTPSMSTYTLLTSKEGTYNLMITGTIGGTHTASANFNLIVNDICTLTAISSSPIAAYTYDISEGTTNTMATLAWTQSQPTCTTPITYSFVTSTGGTAPTFMTLTGTLVTINTNLVANVNTYNMKVIGSVGAYTSTFVTFTVTVTNNCASATVTKNVCSTQNYVVASIADICFFTDWTVPYAYCPSFTYTAGITSPTPGPLPSFITFIAITKQFIIVSTNPTDAGTYTVQVAGALGSAQTATQTFQVIITSPCSSAVLSMGAGVTTPNTYYITDADLVINIPNFSSNYPACGTITYAITQSTNSGSTYTAIDSSVFTYAAGSPATLMVQTSTRSKAGTYLLKVVGSQGQITNQETFTVIIVDRCLTAAISPSSLSNHTYSISDPTQQFSFTAFTVNPAYCGVFIYTATLSDGVTALDSSVLSFTSSSRQFSVYTTNTAKIQTMNLLVVGTVSGVGSDSLTFSLIIKCPTPTISHTSAISQSYKVANTSLSFQMPNYTYSPMCNLEFGYFATLSNGNPLPAFIVFTASSTKFELYTTDNKYAGNYTIMVTAILNDSAMTTDTTLKIPLLVTQAESIPSFTSPPVDQTVVQGSTLQYQLPTTQDTGGTDVTVSISAEFSTATLFVSFNTNSFQISPTKSTPTGKYAVTVTLTNSNGATQIYTFNIFVESKSLGVTQNISVSTNSSNFSSLSTSDFLKNVSSLPKVEPLNISTTLTALITTISQNGLMTLTFNEAMLIPANYTSFNDSVMEVKVLPGPDSDKSLLSFTWNITAFSSSQITVQLNFDNPLIVSKNTVRVKDLYSRTRIKFRSNLS